MIIYTDANPTRLAYVQDPGRSDSTEAPAGSTSMQAEYMAIIYALNEYFIRWGRELDERDQDRDVEKSLYTGEEEFATVSGSASRHTPRALPPPIEIRCDNQVVVNQLARQYHIGDDKLRKLATQIWNMTQNISVRFIWVSRKENLAGKMLK